MLYNMFTNHFEKLVAFSCLPFGQDNLIILRNFSKNTIHLIVDGELFVELVSRDASFLIELL